MRKSLALAGRYLQRDAAGLELRDAQVYPKGEQFAPPLLDLDTLVALASPASPYHDGEPGLETTAYFHTNQLTYSYGTHVAHVAVDPETGKVEVLRYAVVEDIGRCINPLLVQGQTVGAAVQGIGRTDSTVHPSGLGNTRQSVAEHNAERSARCGVGRQVVSGGVRKYHVCAPVPALVGVHVGNEHLRQVGR